MAEIRIRDDGSLLYSSNCIYPLTCLFFPLNYKLECLKFIVEKWTHLHDVLKVELIRLVDILNVGERAWEQSNMTCHVCIREVRTTVLREV